MTLMSNRCTSARGEGGGENLFNRKEPAFGVHVPQYFYVQQKRPRAIAPLRVWRGYKGNVYFEPLSIQKVRSGSATRSSSNPAQQPPPTAQDSKPKTAEPTPRSVSAIQKPSTAPVTPSPRQTITRATTAAASSASGRSYRLVPSSPQVYIMDKQAVISSLNTELQEDLKCIEGMESTGSLAVRPLSGSTNQEATKGFRPHGNNRSRLLQKRDRICRGSNFHIPGGRICVPVNGNVGSSSASVMGQRGKAGSVSTGLNANSRRSSFASSRFTDRKQYSLSAGNTSRSRLDSRQDLVISGDRFCPPSIMSPLLRSTTQFSITHPNSAIDTPDILRTFDNRLPPLSHVHVDLGHTVAETDSDPALSRPSSYYDELSHHVKQQANLGY